MQPAANKVRNVRVKAAGFSLVEMVVSILIISIAMVGISSSLAFGLRHQSDGIWRTKAVALAEAYFEEISARRYDENTPNGGVPACSPTTTSCSTSANFADGEVRGDFDDVDDYNGISDMPPQDATGVTRSGYNNYRVSVDVAYATAAQVAALGLADATDAKIVTIRVTPPGQQDMEFTLLRSNY